MADNRSLDEFLAGEADPEREVEEPAAESAEQDGPEPVDEDDPEPVEEVLEPAAESPEPAAADDESVEPMAITVAWAPDGAACEACGATVEERWRDGDALVCGDCKAW